MADMTPEQLAAIEARHREIDYQQTAGCNCFEQCWVDTEALIAEVKRLQLENQGLGKAGGYGGY